MTVFGMRNMPEDHPLNRVYRVGGGLIGAVLLVFGLLGFFGGFTFFDTGDRVAGLSTNGLLNAISVVVGLVLIGAALRGGNTAADANAIFGALFLVSGFANMCVLRTSWNVLNFSMTNVIFSFVVGLLLLTFGFYGRVSGGLSQDNPYYRARHGMDPRTGEVVDDERAAGTGGRPAEGAPARRPGDVGPDPRV